MERQVDAGECRIAYQIQGPAGAPALLLVNSIGTTMELWARQVPGLKAMFRVIRYDTRGHGRSSVPPGEYTIDQLGSDALAVLDDAGIAEAHVCGISLGGLTAMWLGIHAPSRVASLVLANTAARVGTVQSWTDRIALVREQGMRAVAERAIPIWFTPGFRARDGDTVHGFRAMLQECPPDGYAGCCAALRDADLREALGAIRRPTLVIGGNADPSTPVSAAELIRDRIEAGRLVTLDAAHLSNVEQAEAFTDAVVEFLTTQAGAVHA